MNFFYEIKRNSVFIMRSSSLNFHVIVLWFRNLNSVTHLFFWLDLILMCTLVVLFVTCFRPMYNHPLDDPDDTDQQHDSDARNTTYPTELYTLDEFLAEEDLLDSFAEEIAVELKGT